MPIQDISIIERAIADPLSRERLGRALSCRHSEVRAILDPAFEGFFEARLGQRADISSISGERRLALAAYAKLAYWYGFRIDSRLLREADGRAYLGKAWERVLGARRLRLIPEPSVETRAEACRRRFSLDTIFTHPLDRIAAGAAFDRADILLLSQRGDDCSPLFFVDGTGTPAGLSSIERAEEEVFFSPVRTMEGDDTLSLADILPSAFDHLVVGRQIARFDLSPEPWYYRRRGRDEPPTEAELYPGCEVRTAGLTLRADEIVRATLSRWRSQRIFETRFRRLLADRVAGFLIESLYDRHLRAAFRAFDGTFPRPDSLRAAAEGRDPSIFALVRSLAMIFPWHVRGIWRSMLPELAARAWGATMGHRDAMDTVVVRDGEDPWRFPEATEHALLHVCAYSFGGSARRTVAFARDGGWHAFDFDRESYVPLATFLHSADAYSLRSYETSRPEPGCVEW